MDALKQKLQSTLRYTFFSKIFHNGCQCLYISYFNVHVITLSTIKFSSKKLHDGLCSPKKIMQIRLRVIESTHGL